MSSKRRLAAYRGVALKAQKGFSFGKPFSVCAAVSADAPELKSILASVAAQTYRDFTLFIASPDGAALRTRLPGSLPEAKTIAAGEFRAAVEGGSFRAVIPDLTAPLPPDAFFRVAQAAALHPEAERFDSCGEGFDAVTPARFVSGEASGEVCFTGSRPSERAFTEAAKALRAQARICAGMVVFNGDLEKVAANVANILPSVDAFFLVDNGSDDLSLIERRFDGEAKLTLIRNGENKGIAYALNRALDAADEGGFDWLLTLDQDTVCDPELINVYSRYLRLDSLGIICPYVIHRGACEPDEYLASPKQEAEFFHTYDRCITSAALTNVKAAKEIGGWNDELFIDAVDFDFNHRLLSAGWRILRANDAYIVQEIGERVPVKLYDLIYCFIGDHKYHGPKYFSVHSDLRLYYIARNYRWFLKKYKAPSPTVSRRANFKDMLLRFLLYPRKRSRIKMLRAVRRGRRDSKKMTY